jgi:hypothetical protein
MHASLKASAALVLVALMGAPAFAATNDTAIVTNAMKADALPIASVTAMVGKWSSADLSFLDKATAIKVFDTKALYDAADQKKIASAEAARNADLTKFRAAIAADAGLSAWFKSHNLDVNRVIAVADPSGNPQVFLY